MSPWLSVPLFVHLGIVVTMFLVAFAIGRYAGVDPKYRALPTWAQMLVMVLTFSPFFAQSKGLVPTILLDDTTLSFALILALWVVLPVLAYELLDPEPSGAAATC